MLKNVLNLPNLAIYFNDPIFFKRTWEVYEVHAVIQDKKSKVAQIYVVLQSEEHLVKKRDQLGIQIYTARWNYVLRKWIFWSLRLQDNSQRSWVSY